MNVLIIGGSSDIGINLATYLNGLGNHVIATYNHHECHADNIEYLKLDLNNEKEVEDTIKYAIDKYQNIDVLINMAAIYYDDELANLNKDDYIDACKVNIVGSFLTMKYYHKYVHDGLIINIASTDGIDTYNAYNIIYASTKAALINMTKSVSMATHNKVVCLAPNWIASDSTNQMDKTYLNSELKRINQSRLITIDEFNKSIKQIIDNDLPTGSILRLDIKGDKLCIEKMP